MFNFSNIDPVIFSVGPLAVTWYSMAYVCGILIAWFYANKLILLSPMGINKNNIENFINWAIISIIIGGRLGHVLFYEPKKYFSSPIEILKTYEGGMSFHGAICAIGIAAYIYSKKNHINFFSLLDIIATTSTIGIFFGRIANFINGELYGRPTDMPWGIIFPYSDDNAPRHPTQLYEAFLEGFVLFLIMLYFAYRQKFLNVPGKMLGIFLVFYSSFRIIIEFFKEPEGAANLIIEYFTLGQLLCIPMFLFGIYLLIRANWTINDNRCKNKIDN